MGSQIFAARGRASADTDLFRTAIAGLVLAVLLGFGGASARAATFDEGWQAFQTGDFAKALEIWVPLAKAGDKIAQFNVGVMHDQGRGTRVNKNLARDFLTQSAEQGYLPAQHNLALLLIGDANRAREGIKWLERAADGGFARSQYTLGKIYLEGGAVKANPEKALKLIGKAGEAGLARAQYNLGKMYRDGIGTSANPEVSVSWFRQAAERGHASAQSHFATRLEKGIGIDVDKKEALKWAILAAKQGVPAGIKTRDRLSKSLSDADRESARQAAEAFVPLTD